MVIYTKVIDKRLHSLETELENICDWNDLKSEK